MPRYHINIATPIKKITYGQLNPSMRSVTNTNEAFTQPTHTFKKVVDVANSIRLYHMHIAQLNRIVQSRNDHQDRFPSFWKFEHVFEKLQRAKLPLQNKLENFDPARPRDPPAAYTNQSNICAGNFSTRLTRLARRQLNPIKKKTENLHRAGWKSRTRPSFARLIAQNRTLIFEIRRPIDSRFWLFGGRIGRRVCVCAFSIALVRHALVNFNLCFDQKCRDDSGSTAFYEDVTHVVDDELLLFFFFCFLSYFVWIVAFRCYRFRFCRLMMRFFCNVFFAYCFWCIFRWCWSGSSMYCDL